MDFTIYIVQAIAFLFAIVLAKHDAPAVLHFEHYGATDKVQARFHRYNVWVKFLFCLLAAITSGYHWQDILWSGSLAALWIYLVFDIAINLNRPGIDWDYLGKNDADGRLWIKGFGKNAGKIKAVILFLLIIALNILKILL